MSVSRNTTYNLLGSAIPIILSLVTVPIYLRLVGPERYGVLAIAWLLLGYFGLFDLGLGRATSFRIAALRDAPPQARADAIWAAVMINLGMGVIGAIALWAASFYFFGSIFKVDESLRPEIVAALPYLACAAPIALLSGVFIGALQGREKFLETNAISVTSTALFQILPLGVAWIFGPNLSWLLLSAIAARVLAMVSLGLSCHREFFKGQALRLVRGEIPGLLKYGGWVSLSAFLVPMLIIVDRFAIGAVLGSIAVTVYTAPFQLAQRLQVLPRAVTTALFPRMSAAAPAEQTVMSDKAILAIAFLATTPVLGAILILDPFLHLWLGASIGAQSAPVGRILMIAFWCNAFALVPFMRLQSMGRPDLVTKIMAIEIPPYFLALYFALMNFGLMGCAVVFLARCIVDYALLTWTANREFRTAPALAGNLVLLSLATAATYLWRETEWQLWASGSVLLALSLGLGWLSMPADIKAMVAGRLPFLRRGPMGPS